MASSDDEGEEVVRDVSDYYFEDDKDEPISFSQLPVKWDEGKVSEDSQGKVKEIFLRGSTDNRRRSVHRQVIAWKFDLSLPKPEILVLSTKNEWIKLLQARKVFENTIRTVLITVHFLHLLKKKPEMSGKGVWDKLSKIFSFEPRPSENDLVNQMSLISEALQRDENLKESNVLVTFLNNPKKTKSLEEDGGTSRRSNFIVVDNVSDRDDVNDETLEDASDDDEEEDGFDSVCAICDNGGDILCCEGRCLRSFHATREAGSESKCKSLGFSDAEVRMIQIFVCTNCKFNQHQCYACGKLGSSDKSTGAEVFRCVIATCGHFYHPRCVAKLLSPKNETRAGELQESISAGGQFTCPIHECRVCKQGENKDEEDLQFAVCRRCPKSYHRKCLPREIAFDDDEDEEIRQRAWEGLLPNGRILIYCLEHEIDDDLCTPLRNHIIFPGDTKKQPSLLSTKKGNAPSSEDTGKKSSVVKTSKVVKKVQGYSSKKKEKRLSVPDSSGKQRALDISKKTLTKSSSGRLVGKSITAEGEPSLGERLYALISQDSEPDEQIDGGELEETQIASSFTGEEDSSLALDVDTEKRLFAMIEDAASSVTLEDIEKNCKLPTGTVYSSKFMDKSITLGKVEASIEAIQAALQKFKDGGSLENAKSVCEPRLLNQLMRWRDKLKVYLAPFLHGNRYTSFGRHFTKVDKLKAIADRLRWYVQDGDMIVDFCCGANDFSCIMKEELDRMGKLSCAYKNYDIYPPKNDFNFEKRDWMSVLPKELPEGSKLIMGLNPPFGLNANLANKFIDKALQFKPKLLILIVPRETERLDAKSNMLRYDLVWEDEDLLAGKSFYLPGSIDVNEKQMEDWNVSTPPLYLWSHPHWTSKHKSIAQQQGQLMRMHEELELNQSHSEMAASDHPPEHPPDSCVLLDDQCVQNKVEQSQERGVRETETAKGMVTGTENSKNKGPQRSRPNQNSRKWKRGRGSEESLQEDKNSRKRSASYHSPSPIIGGKSLDNSFSKPSMTSPHAKSQREDHHISEHGRASGSNLQLQTRNDDARRYSSGREEHMPRYSGNQDDDRRRYITNAEEAVLSVNNWSNTSSPGLSYGFRAQNEQQLKTFQQEAYHRETSDVLGHRAYTSGSDPYRRDSTIREQVHLYGRQDTGYTNHSTIQEQIQRYGRQEPDYADRFNIREQVQLYGRQDPVYTDPSNMQDRVQLYGRQDPNYGDQSSSFPGGIRPVCSPSYSQLGAAANSSHNWTSTSALQRYAPRLDELNHTRMNPTAPEPNFVGMSGVYDPRASRPAFRANAAGFAPGPYPSFSPHGSSGWLNE